MRYSSACDHCTTSNMLPKSFSSTAVFETDASEKNGPPKIKFDCNDVKTMFRVGAASTRNGPYSNFLFKR